MRSGRRKDVIDDPARQRVSTKRPESSSSSDGKFEDEDEGAAAFIRWF
jgi:hypothetical protein